MHKKRITISRLTFVLIVSFLFGSSNPFDLAAEPKTPIQGEAIGLLASE